MQTTLSPFLTRSAEAFGKPVCRLGLAWQCGTDITSDDVLDAISRGVNFLNWPGEADNPGTPDAFTGAIGSLGAARESVVVCIQFGARSAADAEQELRSLLRSLNTGYIDVLTLYYVERIEEWRRLMEPDGALAYLRAAKEDGLVRRIGITSHQRPLAAEMAQSGLLETVMIRYNAAHRGAEREIFPTTDARRIPVIAYTALRWGALLKPTPDDPPGYSVPRAAAWYRFVLQSPSVAVVLSAPHTRQELEEDLRVLEVTGPMGADEHARLAEHGERVRRHAGRFP